MATESADNILILRGLEAALNAIRVLLGREWPSFSRKFLDINARIVGASEPEQRKLIDELLDLGFASPAADIFREVLRSVMSARSDGTALTHTRQYKLNIAATSIVASSRTGPEAVRHAAQQFAGEMAPRYLNVCITDTVKRSPIGAQTPLATGAGYFLRLDIGLLSADSVVEDAEAQPFPAERLPPAERGHWLDIAVVSRDFDTPRRRFSFFLPLVGSSWVCGCPRDAGHVCASEDRRPYVYVPVRTPTVARDAELRLAVYFGKNLVQSQVLTATVSEEPKARGGYHSRIDFSLTARLTDVGFLPSRDLGILTNQHGDGTHTLVFNGALQEVVDLSFTEGQMSGAVEAVRATLKSIHLDEWGGGLGAAVQRRSRYDANNNKAHAEFVADLRQLAEVGWWLWASLWRDRLDFWREHRDQFVQKSSVIQVARKKGSRFVFPWAAVYDIPLQTGAPQTNRECKLLDRREWQKFVEQTAEWPSSCPYEAEHKSGVICPFGFWGYRYQIEQPPSMPLGRAMPLRIPSDEPPLEFVLATSEDLAHDLRSRHVAALREQLRRFSVQECRSREDIELKLATPDLEVIYFYCHGSRREGANKETSIPSLGVGSGELIEPEDLVAWSMGWPVGHWRDTSPLVFINGCHTVDLTPGELVNFVDVFAGLNASGVIGTEIVVHQQVANEAAETFLLHFQGGRTVGDALHQARIGLLRKGNLLGLAYTPYCSVSLRLADAKT